MALGKSFGRARELEEAEKRKHAQRKAAREEKEAKDREKERERRVRLERLLGRAAAKIGLLDLADDEEIDGAVLSLERGVSDEKTRAAWKKDSAARKAREAAEKDRAREALVIRFPGPLSGLEKSELRKTGLRENKLWGHWEGSAVLEEAEALARARDGEVIRGGGLRAIVGEQRLPEAAE